MSGAADGCPGEGHRRRSRPPTRWRRHYEYGTCDSLPGNMGDPALPVGDRRPERECRRYRVEVRGNNFVQAGGDVDTVTGAFFGAAHEGMGGVIVTDDLSAGFVGTR